MTIDEMSNAFDMLINWYNKNGLQFDEYEKSYFFTIGQNAFVTSCYDGKNQSGYQFEVTEEDRRILDALVRTKDIADSLNSGSTTCIELVPESKFYSLPDDVMFITYEEVIFGGSGTCAYNKYANIVPVTQDDFWKTYNNPFRTFNNSRVLRLDAGERTVELVTENEIQNYIIRYIKKPNPIIFVDMPANTDLTMFGGQVTKSVECELDDSVHEKLVEIAVNVALKTNGIQNT